MIERWKPVNGYEGEYEVSDMGRVKTVKRQIKSKRGDGYTYSWKTKVLKPLNTHGNYLRACLYKNGVKQYFSIHRLVVEAFIPNPDGKTQVNHINGDKKDNKAENLEWATPSENMFHKYQVLGHKGKCTTQTPVQCIETGEIFGSQLSAAEAKHVTQGGISNAVSGKACTCGGLHWRYINKEK